METEIQQFYKLTIKEQVQIAQDLTVFLGTLIGNCSEIQLADSSCKVTYNNEQTECYVSFQTQEESVVSERFRIHFNRTEIQFPFQPECISIGTQINQDTEEVIEGDRYYFSPLEDQFPINKIVAQLIYNHSYDLLAPFLCNSVINENSFEQLTPEIQRIPIITITQEISSRVQASRFLSSIQRAINVTLVGDGKTVGVGPITYSESVVIPTPTAIQSIVIVQAGGRTLRIEAILRGGVDSKQELIILGGKDQYLLYKTLFGILQSLIFDTSLKEPHIPE
jgi:hypothetical protein